MNAQSTSKDTWNHRAGGISSGTGGVEQLVRGEHLRACRGLLDWSRSQLSAHCALSLSTIRRLEDDDAQVSLKLFRVVIATLQSHGIVFSLTDNGILSVGRYPEARASS